MALNHGPVRNRALSYKGLNVYCNILVMVILQGNLINLPPLNLAKSQD